MIYYHLILYIASNFYAFVFFLSALGDLLPGIYNQLVGSDYPLVSFKCV